SSFLIKLIIILPSSLLHLNGSGKYNSVKEWRKANYQKFKQYQIGLFILRMVEWLIIKIIES
ncbi:MAG: hypothetical protein ACKPHO_06430, partial [Dolichospermum sp.]